jgi:hypothetical protein
MIMAIKHERPEYVLNYKKPKNTEIKYISGNWYLYERKTKYNPETKKSTKVSGKMIGKITKDGFVAKKVKASVFKEMEVKEYGASYYFISKSRSILDRLKDCFPYYGEQLYVIAILRILYGKAFKRIDLNYESSYISNVFPNLSLSSSTITSLLKDVGRDRGGIKKFMNSYARDKDRFILFDGHRIISSSKNLDMAEVGYDSKSRYSPQVNLIYMFSLDANGSYPEYYKQYIGSVPDVSVFEDIIKETNIKDKDATIIADKGFGSNYNFDLIEDSGMNYIIPLRRGNLETKGKIPASIAEYRDAFIYHNRNIHCLTIKGNDYNIHLYLDGSLHNAELKDVIRRTEKKNNSIEIKRERELKRREQDKLYKGEILDKRLKAKSRLSDEELSALVPLDISEIIRDKVSTGTITIKTNRKELNAKQVYVIYKQRQAIEQFFKTYDNTLGYDSSYMRNDYSLEAWLFINHLCMMMSMDAIEEISNINEANNISLADLITTLRKIKATKIEDKWYLSKFTRHVTILCEKLDIKFKSQEIKKKN